MVENQLKQSSIKILIQFIVKLLNEDDGLAINYKEICQNNPEKIRVKNIKSILITNSRNVHNPTNNIPPKPTKLLR